MLTSLFCLKNSRIKIDLSLISTVYFQQHSTGVLFDETFTKYGADGSLEEYWCSSGAKVVTPPPTTGFYNALDCKPTALVMSFTIPTGPQPIYIQSVAYKFDDAITHDYVKLFCDA
jgi:hypothetical protein